MSGIDFHTTLTRTHPDQADRVVFISGGATTTKSAAFLALFPDRQLEKPFNHAALKSLVAAMMQPRDPPA
jgi:DNA-binding response OmpR family regulator